MIALNIIFWFFAVTGGLFWAAIVAGFLWLGPLE